MAAQPDAAIAVFRRRDHQQLLVAQVLAQHDIVCAEIVSAPLSLELCALRAVVWIEQDQPPLAERVRSLRREGVLEVIRTILGKHANRDDFRVVEFNVLGNHLHFVVEAAGAMALARGMQGLAVRLARAINKLLGRSGKLFKERYHARALTRPLEVRNALRYVLLNARHHAGERGEKLHRDWVDPFSSAPWFDGWRTRGLLAFDEVPGAHA